MSSELSITYNSKSKTLNSQLNMTNDELKSELLLLQPSLGFEEGTEFLTMNIDPEAWPLFAKQLRDKENLFFNYLFCLTCIDWKTHLTMV